MQKCQILHGSINQKNNIYLTITISMNTKFNKKVEL